MAKSKTIVAHRLFYFRDVVEDRHVITTTVGPDLNPIILSLGKEPDYRVEKVGASFAKKKANQPNDFRIHHCVEDQWFTVEIETTVENIHTVQPLGAEQWLLVRCRASSPSDRNAHVADSYGRVVRSFHAGDGIEDVQTTTDSKIWCSFFDEGVFSGMTLGQSGLVCLDGYGRKLFDYEQVVGQNNPIADCYALNVCGNHDTWLYYYTDFPLVRITDFQLAHRWPRMPVSGSHAFAVGREHVLFFGSYNDRYTLFQVHLSTVRVQKLIAVTAEGRRIKATAAFGRGHQLYLATKDALYLVDWKA